MAERALDAWIGKDVWVVIGDEEGEPYFGILEGWDERGVILRERLVETNRTSPPLAKP